MAKLGKLVVEIESNTPTPTRLFAVVGEGHDKQDVEVTLEYEHGWIDSGHFHWMLPEGRYWVCQGNKNVFGVVVAKRGKVEIIKPEDAKETTVEPVVPVVEPAVVETVDEPVVPIVEPVVEIIDEPVVEPVVEIIDEPVVEPVVETVDEIVDEPVE